MLIRFGDFHGTILLYQLIISTEIRVIGDRWLCAVYWMTLTYCCIMIPYKVVELYLVMVTGLLNLFKWLIVVCLVCAEQKSG